jgi:hypothetical protein
MIVVFVDLWDAPTDWMQHLHSAGFQFVAIENQPIADQVKLICSKAPTTVLWPKWTREGSSHGEKKR